MKFFKNTISGEVLAYEADGSQDVCIYVRDETGDLTDELINPALRAMTPAEVEAHRNPPATPVARVVSMRQARLALLSMGLLDDVEAAIKTLPEPQQTAARIEWEYATEVRSDNETVLALAGAIGLDLVQLFEIAGGIQ